MVYLPDGKSPAAECVTAIDRLAASVMVLIVSSTQLGFPPMNTFDPAQIRTIGIIGSGTIGASWAAYFLARGYQVHAWDPASGWQDRLQQFIDTAWPQLAKLGLVVDGATAHVSFAETPEAVVKAAPNAVCAAPLAALDATSREADEKTATAGSTRTSVTVKSQVETPDTTPAVTVTVSCPASPEPGVGTGGIRVDPP